jgi:hypothetical protein
LTRFQRVLLLFLFEGVDISIIRAPGHAKIAQENRATKELLQAVLASATLLVGEQIESKG